jgi:hypothetical protein
MSMNHRSPAFSVTSQLDDQLVATLKQKPPYTALCRVHEVVDVVYKLSYKAPLN